MATWLGKIHYAVNFFQVACFAAACLIGGAMLPPRRAPRPPLYTSPRLRGEADSRSERVRGRVRAPPAPHPNPLPASKSGVPDLRTQECRSRASSRSGGRGGRPRDGRTPPRRPLPR